MTSFFAWTSQILLLVLGLFLMIIVLLQRGRGGGLAGAFGGMGGQSAFGTKAGDVFTKITIGVALAWVLTAGLSGFVLRAAAEQKGSQFGDSAPAVISADPDVPTAGSVPDAPQPPAGKNAGEPAETGAATPDAGESSTTEPSTTEPAAGDETPSQN